MDIKEPKFIQTEEGYYFNVETNTIYGEKKYSYLYFHELSHYLDHMNEDYKITSYFFGMYAQILTYIFVIVLIVSLFKHEIYSFLNTWAVFLGLYSVYAGFIIAEEIRAYFNGLKRYLEWKKRK